MTLSPPPLTTNAPLTSPIPAPTDAGGSVEASIQDARHDLLRRGCSEAQAEHVLSLLLRMGLPVPEFQRYIDDLWSLVNDAFDAIACEEAGD